LPSSRSLINSSSNSGSPYCILAIPGELQLGQYLGFLLLTIYCQIQTAASLIFYLAIYNGVCRDRGCSLFRKVDLESMALGDIYTVIPILN